MTLAELEPGLIEVGFRNVAIEDVDSLDSVLHIYVSMNDKHPVKLLVVLEDSDKELVLFQPVKSMNDILDSRFATSLNKTSS